jgi:hypothetical protein
MKLKCLYKFKTNKSTEQEMKMRNQHITEHHRAFMTYVRTKMFLKTRFRGIEGRKPVFISHTEIEKRFFANPAFNKKRELATLVSIGELAISEVLRPDGSKYFLYEALKPGPIDLSMLRPISACEDDLIMRMKRSLTKVSLPFGSPSTPYFDLFLKHKDKYLDLFFRVDDFSGRVHTPVTSFHSNYRLNILLEGFPTCSIDVCTMQPLLLGKILKDQVGDNDFSLWIDSGEDIYNKLQKIAGLSTRDEAKKRFFEILFAPANDNLAKVFGQADWIVWINHYKTASEPRNPHSNVKPYSNLAWLLQSTEVSLMRKVWQEMDHAEIPFLSVHDEVIIKISDQHKAMDIFNKVFSNEFKFYKITAKGLESNKGDLNIDGHFSSSEFTSNSDWEYG